MPPKLRSVRVWGHMGARARVCVWGGCGVGKGKKGEEEEEKQNKKDKKQKPMQRTETAPYAASTNVDAVLCVRKCTDASARSLIGHAFHKAKKKRKVWKRKNAYSTPYTHY